MRVLYLECGMGAAGDMLMAALSELLPEPQRFAEEMEALRIPGVHFERTYKMSAGVEGAHMHVYVHGEEEQGEDVTPEQCREADHAHPHDHDHDCGHHHHHDHAHPHDPAHEHLHDHSHAHHHVSMADIRRIVAALPVSERVRRDVEAVYQCIAEAESAAHHCPVEEVHFHEVGAMDAVADITGVCLLMEKLRVDRVFCSPVHVGSGMVRCAHGVLPVPAPATAAILKGIPCYGGTIQGELCTPTGAALLKHFVDSFGPMPVMAAEKIGIGVGTKEFPAANMLRAFLGESDLPAFTVEELSCNLDDCTGEEIGYAMEVLLQQGALDVFTIPIQMKKSRPGILLTVIARPEDADRMAELMLRHTSTLGVRRRTCARNTLERRIETVETPWGQVRVKISGSGALAHQKAEFEDIAAIAREKGMTLRQVRALVEQALAERQER